VTRERILMLLEAGPLMVEEISDRLGVERAEVRSALSFLAFTDRRVRGRRDGMYELGDPGPLVPVTKEHI
jgi:predicted transcriptional regulator